MFISLVWLTAAGMLVVLGLYPLRLVAWQLVRLVAALALAGIGLALAWRVQGYWDHPATTWEALSTLALGAAALGTLGVFICSPRLRKESSSWAPTVSALSLVSGLITVAAAVLPTQVVPAPVWLCNSLSRLVGALMLGSVCLGWLLGHRYLRATEMSIRPLRRASLLFQLAVAARWVFLVAMLIVLALGLLEPLGGHYSLSRLVSEWIVLSIRVGVGLLLPTVLAYMAADCVKMRSTQSATGILFFTSIMVVMGEMAGLYLIKTVGFTI